MNNYLTGVLTALFGCLHGWCHVKLMLALCKFCVHHTIICMCLYVYVCVYPLDFIKVFILIQRVKLYSI